MLISELERRYGSTEIERRLLKRRIIAFDTACWEWAGARSLGGYGRMKLLGRDFYTHRLAAMIWLGLDPCVDLEVCHACDNPACFNPEHLWLGSHADNMHDAMAKGHVRPPHRWPGVVPVAGEVNGASKLRETEVLAIRTRYSAGGSTQQAIAAEFGVSQKLVSLIVNGKLWRHLLPPERETA